MQCCLVTFLSVDFCSACVIFWLLQSLFLHFLLCHVSFSQLFELWLSKPFLVWAHAVQYVFFYSMLSARYSAVLPVYLFLDPVSVTFWSIGYHKIIINLFLITYNFKVNYSLHVQFKYFLTLTACPFKALKKIIFGQFYFMKKLYTNFKYLHIIDIL